MWGVHTKETALTVGSGRYRSVLLVGLESNLWHAQTMAGEAC